MTLMTALDLALVLLLALRLTRLITTDDLGQNLIAVPIQTWIWRKDQRNTIPPSRWKWWGEGLDCPFCIGWWLGALALLSLFLAGGPGDASDWWRYGAGAFALNYVVGHVASRLDA